MKKQKGLMVVVLLVAVVLMAVGYAALEGIDLTITANAQASANTENFKVYFTGENTKKSVETDGHITVSADKESTTATVNFNKALGLDTKGDEAYVILEIENGSNAVDASSVEVKTNGTDTSMFDFEAVMCNADGEAVVGTNAVAAGAKTYVKVSVKLLQTPVADTEVVSTTITITATPKANV